MTLYEKIELMTKKEKEILLDILSHEGWSRAKTKNGKIIERILEDQKKI